MASNHAAAVAVAVAGGQALGDLFAQIGGAQRPDGRIWQAFRLARQALGARFTTVQLQEVQRQLALAVQDAATDLVGLAVAQGRADARAQLAAYGVAAPSAAPDALIAQAAHEAVLGGLAQQQRAILINYAVAGDPTLVVGDGARVGALSPAPTALALATWLTTAHQAAFAQTAAQARGPRFRRQAIAAIDRRTTRCCLQVHGQVVDLDAPFRLSGTPRFGDQLRNPPFHHYCRTVTALVPAEQADDALTAQLIADARAALAALAA